MSRTSKLTPEERKARRREVALKWYYDNKERALARMKVYTDTYPQKKVYDSEYYHRNKEKLLEYTYAYKERLRVEELLLSGKEVIYCDLCNRPFNARHWNRNKDTHICKGRK